jgi:hypothetical protein
MSQESEEFDFEFNRDRADREYERKKSRGDLE